ncbi:metallophosphoesterase family protein [Streptomyces sp. NPDC050658]|uniref:metallophosphoesterase family protein n=1 Tax=unclassified Streptomyces TaxID=2593676 RepID=UPI00343FDA36
MDRRAFIAAGSGTLAAGAVLAPQNAHAAAGESTRKNVKFNIISDIQGDLADFGKALDDMAEINPDSAGLGVAGDITPRGYDFEYAQVRAELKRHPHPKNVAWAIGNHEFYVPKYKDPDTLAQDTWPNGTTEDSLFRSFYRFAERGSVYEERSFGGIPVLTLGTERYAKYHDPKLWDEVWISDAQFTWLEDRLAHWSRRRKPVMVLTHHPLPNTVSGTRNKLYLSDYLQPDRLLGLLGRHPDVFLFSGHTHWDLDLSDWVVRRVVPGTANLAGFNVVNTGAIQTGWRDNGTGGEVAVEGAFNQGLQVEVGRDSVVIRARDFARRAWLKEITVPLMR